MIKKIAFIAALSAGIALIAIAAIVMINFFRTGFLP
jgi:hypothetical protein